MHPYRPAIDFSAFKEMVNFSRWLIINNLFAFSNTKLPELALGKTGGTAAAAIYSLANEIATMITLEVISNLNRAIYPGYAKVSGNFTKLRELYTDSLKAISLIALPSGIGIALVAEYLVPVFLGDQWLEAIQPVVFLSLAGSLGALNTNVSYIYYAINKPKLSTIEQGIKACIFTVAMLYLIPLYGVLGAATALLITNTFAVLISIAMLRYVLKLSIRSQLAIYLKPIFASGLMVVTVLFAKSTIAINHNILGLTLFATIGAIIYTTSVFGIWLALGKPSGLEAKIAQTVLGKLRKA